MRPSFHPRLINGPFDDPGLFIPLTYRKQALLIDLGDLSNLSAGDILKISHIFVTHTHMDHFVGFDRVLRLMLGRPKNLHLFGPPGFIQNVEAKLRAYTWNLVRNYLEALTVTVTEIRSKYCLTQTFGCQSGFAPEGEVARTESAAVIHREPALQVRTALLDHQIPCLAFSVQERFHINIHKARLEALDLAVGPWLNAFKSQLFSGIDPQTPVEMPPSAFLSGTRSYTVGGLAEKIACITPGQKVAYVADVVHSPDNEEKIISLAQGADHLYIEAAFLDEHRNIAQAKYHLTARQAGAIARRAGVRQMTVFHHSPRYMDQAQMLELEARRAFQGG